MVKVINTRKLGYLFHYSHFLTDCVIPEICKKVYNSDSVYRIKNLNQTIGNFNKFYEDIMGVKNIELSKEDFDKIDCETINIKGLDGFFTPKIVRVAKDFIFERYSIKKEKGYPKVILVERGNRVDLVDENVFKNIDKDKYIFSNGKERRCINNIDSLKNYLQESKVEYETIVLENMPLEKQIKYFNNADLVIASHGASLCNLIFCEKSTNVIEISPSIITNAMQKNVMHWFKNLSQANQLNYFFVENKIDSIINKIKEVESISNRV